MYENNGLFIFFMRADETLKKISIIKGLQKKHKICYLCLNDTVSSITEKLREGDVNVKDICFIDTLSSHYSSQESTDRCIYVSSPSAINEISEAIIRMKKRCNVFIFDDISSLLKYHEPSSILMFTNSVKTKRPGKMVYIISKEGTLFDEDIEDFISDLIMFAEETKDLTEGIGGRKSDVGSGTKAHGSGAGWPYSTLGFEPPENL